MNTFLFLLLLALPGAATEPPAAATPTAAPAPTPPPGSLDSSKIRLDAHDVTGALADAEAVVAKGGGADAYAARADAKRAAGRPYEEVLADYAQAVKLDPRYLEKYNGFIAQQESELHPKKAKSEGGLNGIPVGYLALGGTVGAVLIVGAVLMARLKEGKASGPDDEAIKPGGKKEEPAGAKDDTKGDVKGDIPPEKEPKKPAA